MQMASLSFDKREVGTYSSKQHLHDQSFCEVGLGGGQGLLPLWAI